MDEMREPAPVARPVTDGSLSVGNMTRGGKEEERNVKRCTSVLREKRLGGQKARRCALNEGHSTAHASHHPELRWIANSGRLEAAWLVNGTKELHGLLVEI